MSPKGLTYLASFEPIFTGSNLCNIFPFNQKEHKKTKNVKYLFFVLWEKAQHKLALFMDFSIRPLVQLFEWVVLCLQIIPEPASPSSSVNGNSSLADTHSSSLYKFKNNIKQRFSAEHSEQERPLALKRRRSDDRRLPSETSSIPSPPPVKYHPPHSPPSPTPGVPIFALHSKGSYYIPLTVDHNVLTPFLAELTHEANPSSLVLHPVTISVNFQQISRPLKQPLCFSQAAVTWSSSQNSFHLPKWATCDTERN